MRFSPELLKFLRGEHGPVTLPFMSKVLRRPMPEIELVFSMLYRQKLAFQIEAGKWVPSNIALVEALGIPHERALEIVELAWHSGGKRDWNSTGQKLTVDARFRLAVDRLKRAPIKPQEIRDEYSAVI